jgi:fatty-acyl-CoA synthase
MDVSRATRNTLFDAFSRSAGKTPENVALEFYARQWTYSALAQAVDNVAEHLRAKGIGHGDRVAALGMNSDGYMILWLACCKIGAIHVPINYSLKAEEVSFLIEDSGSCALFHDTFLQSTVDQLSTNNDIEVMGTLHGGNVFDIINMANSGTGVVLDGYDVSDEDIAQIIYTSGTTGNPKGVVLTHRALFMQHLSCIIHCDINGRDRQIAALPLYHCAQMHCFVMPYLLMGAFTYLVEKPVLEQCIALFRQYSINAFFAPPTVWINFLASPAFRDQDLSQLQKLYYGASIMPVPVIDDLLTLMPQGRLYNLYGQTEISPLATCLQHEDHLTKPGSIGRPVINVETRVVDEEFNDVKPGGKGEIVHRSPQLLQCYWNNEEASAEAFQDGWFRTGDLATIDEDGYLYIVDRIKDVINTGGVLVASRDVEEALLRHPKVENVAVIAVPDKKWIEAVCAVVVLTPDADDIGEDELNQYVEGQLAPYKRPKHYHFVDSLPVNASGKVLKRDLRDVYS